jgi:hypothetical protein
MTNGKINLTMNGQYAIVENAGVGIRGGHEFTRAFLAAHLNLFEQVRFGAGYAQIALKGNRLAKFVAYCAGKGIEVEGCGA